MIDNSVQTICEAIAEADAVIDRIEAQLKAAKANRAELAEAILGEVRLGSRFLGVDLDDNRKASIATVRRPYFKRSREQLVEALKAAGLGLVKEDYNANTLYSYTSELVKAATVGMRPLEARYFDGNLVVPEALREDLALNAVYELRITRK